VRVSTKDCASLYLEHFCSPEIASTTKDYIPTLSGLRLFFANLPAGRRKKRLKTIHDDTHGIPWTSGYV